MVDVNVDAMLSPRGSIAFLLIINKVSNNKSSPE